VTEVRIQTMCETLAAQRNAALDVVAQQQGEISEYRARIASLEAKVAEPTKPAMEGAGGVQENPKC